MRAILLTICCLLMFSGCGNDPGRFGGSVSSTPPPSSLPTTPPSDPSGSVEPSTPPPDPIQEQVAAMSLAEKIGQLVLIGMAGTQMNAATEQFITESHVGGVIFYKANIVDIAQTVALVNALKKANADNPVPLFLSVDQEGGQVNRMPSAFAAVPEARWIGDQDDEALAYNSGGLLGEQVLSLGFNMNYAPVLDVNSNPRNPVIGRRAFGEAADLVSRIGIQVIRGLQDKQVVPVVKHFPGHGDTDTDSHLELPVVNKSLEELHELELIPFRNAITQDADAVMVAHMLLPELDQDRPASFSLQVIQHLLREELGFEGVVMTDDMTMGAIVKHFDIGEAAVESIKAGADLIMVAHGVDTVKRVLEQLTTGVAAGELTEERIDESVYRILRLKRKYQLSDAETKPVDISDLNKRVRATFDN